MILPDGMDDVDARWLHSFTPSGGGSRLPDDALVQGVIVVVSYVRPDGALGWLQWSFADMPVSQSVGLLEMAKLELLAGTPGAVTNLSIDEDID